MATVRTTGKFLPVFVIWDIGPGAGEETVEMMNQAISSIVDEFAGEQTAVPVEFCFIGYGTKPRVKKKISYMTGDELINFEMDSQSNISAAMGHLATVASDRTAIPSEAYAPVAVLFCGGSFGDLEHSGKTVTEIACSGQIKAAKDALGPKSLRMAAGIGIKPDYDVANAFIDDMAIPAVKASDQASLNKFTGWVIRLIRDKASSGNPDAVRPSSPQDVFGKDGVVLRLPDPPASAQAAAGKDKGSVLSFLGGLSRPAKTGCLPVFVLVDISGSMCLDMDDVNRALTDLNQVLCDIEGDVRLCIVTFGDEASVYRPLSKVSKGTSFNLECDGGTSLGKGLDLLYSQMSNAPSNSLNPVAILISDGGPTDFTGNRSSVRTIREWAPMKKVVEGKAGKDATRVSMAIGVSMDNKFLMAFNSDGNPVVQSDPASIRKFFKVIGKSIVTKMESEDADDVKTIDFSSEFAVKELHFK